MNSKEAEDWKGDLSKNIGDIMKPSNPDFGYREWMNFSDDEEDGVKKKSGWATFLELIQRYPIKKQVQNIVCKINQEKAICYINLSLGKRRIKKEG